MAKTHRYNVTVRWTGNKGTGTSGYRAYERSHEIAANSDKPPIPGSSDPAFLGDVSRWNPEELLVASLAACHKLWYLHLCSDAGVIVTDYMDHAEGIMEESADGGGRFISITLRPEVKIAPGCDITKARELHDAAHEKCFIANSLNFPVSLEPQIQHG